MPIDTALLASLEGPNEFETLKKTVEKNPDDFSSWSDLLGKLDDQVRLRGEVLLLGYRYCSQILRHVLDSFPFVLRILEEGMFCFSDIHFLVLR